MSRLSILLAVFGFGLMAPTQAAAQSCYLATESSIVSLDVATASEQFIPLVDGVELQAMAYDPFRAKLYGIAGGRFGVVDPSTGGFAAVAESAGSGEGEEGTMGFERIEALAVDPIRGRMYASVRREDFEDVLIVMDPRTGSAVRDVFGSGRDYVVIESFDNLIDVADLAYDAQRDVLYGIATDAGSRDRLVRIDAASGRMEDVGRLTRDTGSVLEGVVGLSVTLDGSLLGVVGGAARKLYRIDPHTAVAERIVHLSAADDYEPIECYLPPGANRIRGTVYNDANRTEYFEPGEGGVFGVVAHLFRDVNDNDRIDGDDVHLLSTETDGDGDYAFKLYARGDFLVTVDISILPDDAGISTRLTLPALFEGFRSELSSADFAVANLPALLEVSGGGNAGIESEGSMATLLAQRLFTRRQDAYARAALRAEPAPVPYADHPHATFAADAPLAKTGFGDVAQIMPSEGPLSSSAFVVSPDDLLGATNAFSVFAADYLRPEGHRVAALFAATSPLAHPYDHSKTICDRLSGSRLEDVRLIDVDGGSFVLTRTVHADGRVDYASSFIAYRSGDRFVVDSRYSPDEYRFLSPSSEVLNVQVWSLSPRMTASMIENILDRLRAEAPVDLANSGADKPGIPTVFVRDGYYKQGRLYVNLVNRAGAKSVTVKGSLARSEIAAARHQREAYERTVSLKNGTAVDLPLGAVYDVELSIDHDGAEIVDKIYHADGAWSYQRGPSTSISYFETFAEPYGPPAADRFTVERDVYLSGSLGDWAAAFRYLQPGGRATDLSTYGYLEFKANGKGMVRVVLEKEGVDTWDQYGYTIELEPAERIFQLPLNAFTRVDGTGGFRADDVTLIAFYVQPTNAPGERFDLGIRDVSFGGVSTVAAEQDDTVPAEVTLEGNYPNPFNPSTQIRFAVSSAQHVRLTVYDMLGREVTTLVDGLLPAGGHVVAFDGEGLASGTYAYRLESRERVASRMMVLAK